MRILQVEIWNFRGIKHGLVLFPEHGVLVGPNNSTKSTVIEALDLVLGPDRANGPDVVDEHDFHLGIYSVSVASDGEGENPGDGDEGADLCAGDEDDGDEDEDDWDDDQEESEDDDDDDDEDDDDDDDDEDEDEQEGNTGAGDDEELAAIATEIRIEVVLGHLSTDELTTFLAHAEPWGHKEHRLWTDEEIEQGTPAADDYVVRVGFRAGYDSDLDEFVTESFFHSPVPGANDRHARFGRRHKQAVGFLYLRSMRTGRRAATLQRGSLLDVLLRISDARPRVWEAILDGLQNLGKKLDEDDGVRGVLDNIERQVRRFIPLGDGRASRLHVSQLTREHLRTVVSYFLTSPDSGHAVPYDRLGTGTSNVLVLALLSAIAEVKANVIFAAEEPEIAIGPHTQRQLVRELRRIAQQSIVTSHSPYITESFLPDNIVVLRRSSDCELMSTQTKAQAAVKAKILRQQFRFRFAEGLLARAVLVVEGQTELDAVPAASALLAAGDTAYPSFDVAGVVVIPAGSDTALAPTANFFSSLGIATYVLAESMNTTTEEAVKAACDDYVDTGYGGFEDVFAQELDVQVIRDFLDTASGWPDYPSHIPTPPPTASDKEVRKALRNVLKKRKGAGFAARLVDTLTAEQLPESIIEILGWLHEEVVGTLLPHGDPSSDIFQAGYPDIVEDTPESDVDDEADG